MSSNVTRKRSGALRKNPIFDEIRTAKEEENQIKSLEDIEEEEDGTDNILDEDFDHLDEDDRDYDSIRLDPISTFTLSEEDTENSNNQGDMTDDDFTIHKLKANLEFEIHAAPLVDTGNMKHLWKKEGTSRGFGVGIEEIKRRSSLPSALCLSTSDVAGKNHDFSSLPMTFVILDDQNSFKSFKVKGQNKKFWSNKEKPNGTLSSDTVEGIRMYFQMLDTMESAPIRRDKDSSNLSSLPINALDSCSEFASLPSNFLFIYFNSSEAEHSDAPNEVTETDLESSQRLRQLWSKEVAKHETTIPQGTLDGIRAYFRMLDMMEPTSLSSLRKSSTPIMPRVNKLDKMNEFLSLPANFVFYHDLNEIQKKTKEGAYEKSFQPSSSRESKLLYVIHEEVGQSFVQETVEMVHKLKIVTEETNCKMIKFNVSEGGRYTMVDRDFKTVYREADVDEVDFQREDEAPDTNENAKIKEVTTPTGNDNDGDSSDESTDTLLEEAKKYLSIAKTKLVTLDDWKFIESHSKKKSNINSS